MPRRSVNIVNMYGEKVTFLTNEDRHYSKTSAKKAGKSLEEVAVKAHEAGLSYGKYTSGMMYSSKHLYNANGAVTAGTHEVIWTKDDPGWHHIEKRKPMQIMQEVPYAI